MAEAPPAASAPLHPGSRRALFIVFLVVFIDLLGFGIVLPLLPLFGDNYVKPLIGTAPGLGGFIVGLLMASFSAMQFFFAPIWGRISDSVGRRTILLIGLAGSVVFYILFGVALLFPAEQALLALILLFVSRIGAGVAGATIATAQAVIADSTPPEKRKVGMALIGAAFGIGFTFGPLIGALCQAVAPGMPELIGYTAAGLSLIALILGIVLLPETRVFGGAPTARRWVEFRAIREVLAHPALGPVVLVFFLASLGFGGFEVTLALINRDTLGLPSDKNYLMFAYVGLVLMLTQGVLYRRLASRLSETTFMVIGILFMGLGVAFLGGLNLVASWGGLDYPARLTWMMVSTTCAVVGFAFLTPSAQALISRRADPERQGEILGVNQSASALARILGPIFGLSLYHLTPDHLLPYAFGAALLLLMLPVMSRVRRQEQSTGPVE
jgi:MFS family permease